ncbi:MAG: hypothetical protein FIA99_11180 [Ruminiclostridium sp.]|nr:hypothetical protein [Ruminiclostridium sp.]
MNSEEIVKRLAEPFKASEIEWRIQGVDQSRMRGMVVPYIDSRAIQRRLDDVVGPFGWRNEFKQWHENSQLCCISILHTDENESKIWYDKWDGAENSKIEAVKGGLSDSFKRAAVLWGIGRYLYDFGAKWVDVERKGDSFVIKQSEYASLDAFHDSEVQRLSNSQAGGRSKEAPQGSPSAGENTDKGSSRRNTSQTNKIPEKQPLQSTENTLEADNSILYLVKRKLVSTNANGQSTQLEMVCLEDGAIVKAFLRGGNDSIAEGVKLKNIKITEKQGTHRIYNVLEAFEIAS